MEDNEQEFSEEQRKELETAVSAGGKTVAVMIRREMKDGNVVKEAAADSVFVRVLDSMQELEKFLLLLDKENDFAAFITGKTAEYIAALSVDSVLDICEVGQNINFQSALRLAARRGKLVERLSVLAPSAKATKAWADAQPDTETSSVARRAKSLGR